MNHKELNTTINNFYQQCAAIAELKNSDYSAGDDALRNFRASGFPEIGLFTRMMDKMQRIRTFIEKGNFSVADESLVDTLMDLSNYCALYAALLEDGRTRKVGIEKSEK